MCAVLTGAEGWEYIEDFALGKLDWLKKYLPFENGIPKHDTIARVLSRLNAANIQICFVSRVKSIAKEAKVDVIAIDGKVARRSFSTEDRKNSLHMLSAWSCAQGLVLGQQRVDKKSNEITAIPMLLELLDVKGATITLDAIRCQHEIAEKNVDKKADYVIALKGNQGQLSERIKAWFHKAEREQFQGVAHSVFEHTDAGHDRIEVRNCLQLEIENDWLSKREKWSSVKTVIHIDSERHVNDKCTKESRYYISSHKLNAERLNRIIRNHWSVENTLHWTLDMTFHEDDSRIRRGNAAEVMNAFRKWALNIVKTNTTRKASMKRKLKMAALDDELRAELLIGSN